MRPISATGVLHLKSAWFNMVSLCDTRTGAPEIPLEHSLTLKIGSFGNKWLDGAPCG
jgi:hypothetical protein